MIGTLLYPNHHGVALYGRTRATRTSLINVTEFDLSTTTDFILPYHLRSSDVDKKCGKNGFIILVLFVSSINSALIAPTYVIIPVLGDCFADDL